MTVKPIIALIIALCFAVQPMVGAQAKATKINTASSKYAALVMDAETGEVFFARNATARRYPASLTKMMTLYMTFEALKAGRLKPTTPLPVSARAASQPQTNISLKKGQTIRVEQAIKALVVRSANDVAVVLAEALGKTEQNFAYKMTAKARSLGMSRTQFRNAHGLPDRQQYTTAGDMAKLAIALRRDFPQHYHYFKTQEFTWKGREYTSHNRVLDQFDGVDGIKTGYINMSGFNLASSVKRDGYHVVAVVLGGQTSRARDAHMVSLLDSTFSQIAERGDAPRAFAAAPVPKAKPKALQTASSSGAGASETPWLKVSFNADSADKTVPKVEVVEEAPTKAKAAPAAEVKVAESKPLFRFVSDPEEPKINSLNIQLASLKTPPAGVIQEKWGIQVGAFHDEDSAMKAASKAVTLARTELKYSQINITDNGAQAASIHRARLANLTESQAKRACQLLSKKSTPCFVFKKDQQNL